MRLSITQKVRGVPATPALPQHTVCAFSSIVADKEARSWNARRILKSCISARYFVQAILSFITALDAPMLLAIRFTSQHAALQISKILFFLPNYTPHRATQLYPGNTLLLRAPFSRVSSSLSFAHLFSRKIRHKPGGNTSRKVLTQKASTCVLKITRPSRVSTL